MANQNNHSAQTATHDAHDSHEGGHHVVPFTVLRNTAIALILLTFATVAASRMHLGMLETPVAFLIAFVKAMLVMSYFMGLKYDTKLNRLIFSTGFLFLAVFAFFCVLDIWTRIGVTSTL